MKQIITFLLILILSSCIISNPRKSVDQRKVQSTTTLTKTIIIPSINEEQLRNQIIYGDMLDMGMRDFFSICYINKIKIFPIDWNKDGSKIVFLWENKPMEYDVCMSYFTFRDRICTGQSNVYLRNNSNIVCLYESWELSNKNKVVYKLNGIVSDI